MKKVLLLGGAGFLFGGIRYLLDTRTTYIDACLNLEVAKNLVHLATDCPDAIVFDETDSRVIDLDIVQKKCLRASK